MIETDILNIKKHKNFLLKVLTFYSIIFLILVAKLELKLLYVQADWIFSNDENFQKKYNDLLNNKSYQKNSPVIINYLRANNENIKSKILNNFPSQIKEYTQILAQKEKQKIKKEQKKFIVKQFVDVATKKTTFTTNGYYSDKQEIENYIYNLHNQHKEKILEDILNNLSIDQILNYNSLIENEKDHIEKFYSKTFNRIENINYKIEVMYPDLSKLDIKKKLKIAENIKTIPYTEEIFETYPVQFLFEINNNDLKTINLIDVIFSTKIEDIDLNKLALTNVLLTYFENFKFLNNINDTKKKMAIENLKKIELINYRISKLPEMNVKIKNTYINLFPDPEIKFFYKDFFWYIISLMFLLSVILSFMTLYIKIQLKSNK
jgi:hypothetical protein